MKEWWKVENSEQVIKDIEEIKASIQRLGEQVNSAGMEWKDEKYFELRNAIQDIAKNTNELIKASEECKNDINTFSTYANF